MSALVYEPTELFTLGVCPHCRGLEEVERVLLWRGERVTIIRSHHRPHSHVRCEGSDLPALPIEGKVEPGIFSKKRFALLIQVAAPEQRRRHQIKQRFEGVWLDR